MLALKKLFLYAHKLGHLIRPVFMLILLAADMTIYVKLYAEYLAVAVLIKILAITMWIDQYMNRKCKIIYSRSDDLPSVDLTIPVVNFFRYERVPTCRRLQLFLSHFFSKTVCRIDILYHINNHPYKIRLNLDEETELTSGDVLEFGEIKLNIDYRFAMM